VDCPAAWHNGACGATFSDGHSEIHKWKGLFKNLNQVSDIPGALNQSVNDLKSISDCHWLADNATVHN